jgi:hypothetical protein
MGLLTFALNVTLDGCCDHPEMVANDETLRGSRARKVHTY